MLRVPAAARRRLVLAAALLLPCSLAAQRYSFKHYGHEEGLYNLAVHCLLQDRQGFLWVGTQNGLFRYDGRSFQKFAKPEGLPSSRIESLHESADRTLWVGTRSGLARQQRDRFQPVNLGAPHEILGPSSIASDAKGRLYVGTGSGLVVGLPAGRGADLAFRFLPMPRGIASETVYGVHVNPQGVWFGCGSSLCRLKSGRITVIGAEQGVPKERWDAIVTDREGNPWIRSSRRLLVRPKGAKQFIPRDRGLPQSGDFGALALDLDGHLLVPIDLGLAIPAGKTWKRIGAAQGLAIDATSCLLQDREGTVWVGLRGSGVARWLGYKQWESWTQEQGLSNENIWAVARDNVGALWVGTDNGLNRMAPGTQTWRVWTEKQGLGGNRVRVITVGLDGSVWTGSSPGGVSRLDSRSGSIRKFGAASGLANDRVNGLLLDRENRLWASTRGGTVSEHARGAFPAL